MPKDICARGPRSKLKNVPLIPRFRIIRKTGFPLKHQYLNKPPSFAWIIGQKVVETLFEF